LTPARDGGVARGAHGARPGRRPTAPLAEEDDEDWTGGETVVTSELREHHGSTTLTVTIRFSSPAARDAAMTTGFAGGMEAGYDVLAELLAGEDVDA
jgi:hypothetical protein